MKKTLKTLATIAITTCLATSIHAGSIGAYYGVMDTDLLGSGDIVGGVLEMDILPFTSIQLRGGYANSFGKISLGKIKLDSLSDETRDITETILREFDRAGRFQLEDFYVIPIEVGVVGRLSILGFVGIYAGTGIGYYIIPSFDVTSKGGHSLSESVDNPFGYWGLIGIEAGLPFVSLFAEVKYTHILKKDLEIDFEYAGRTGTLNADIDLSGMTYLIGARLKW